MSTRIRPYISDTNAALLRGLASRPNASESSIVDAALTLYVSSQADSVGGAGIIRRLDRLTRQFDRLERNDLVIKETLGLFIRYFLMVVAPVPEERQAAAKAQGEERFESFLEQLGIELKSGRRLLQAAVDSVLTDKSDFFSDDELARLHQPVPDKSEKNHA